MIRSFLLGSGKSRGTDPSRVGLLPLMLPMLLHHWLRYAQWLHSSEPGLRCFLPELHLPAVP